MKYYSILANDRPLSASSSRESSHDSVRLRKSSRPRLQRKSKHKTKISSTALPGVRKRTWEKRRLSTSKSRIKHKGSKRIRGQKSSAQTKYAKKWRNFKHRLKHAKFLETDRLNQQQKQRKQKLTTKSIERNKVNVDFNVVVPPEVMFPSLKHSNLESISNATNIRQDSGGVQTNDSHPLTTEAEIESLVTKPQITLTELDEFSLALNSKNFNETVRSSVSDENLVAFTETDLRPSFGPTTHEVPADEVLVSPPIPVETQYSDLELNSLYHHGQVLRLRTRPGEDSTNVQSRSRIKLNVTGDDSSSREHFLRINNIQASQVDPNQDYTGSHFRNTHSRTNRIERYPSSSPFGDPFQKPNVNTPMLHPSTMVHHPQLGNIPVHRKTFANKAFPHYTSSGQLYHHHMLQGSPLYNQSRPPEGAVFQLGSEWIRAEEVVLVIVVLLLWVGAITMFINRWGKLRMLEPYQPAYCAPVASATRPPNLAGAANIGGLVTAGVQAAGPAIQIQSTTDMTSLVRPKRVDSLTSFRDNFREGYKDAYRYWGMPSNSNPVKSFSSGLGGLGLRGMTGVWGVGSSTLGVDSGPFGESNAFKEYRRASSGSTLGLGLAENGITCEGATMGSRSRSISGSSHHLHQFHQHNHSVRNVNHTGSHSVLCHQHHLGGSSTHDLEHRPQQHRNPAISIANTSITITNTEEEQEDSGSASNSQNNSTSNSRYNSNMNLNGLCTRTNSEGVSPCCSNPACCEQGMLKPLASQIKVRSAVDLVTLVMQEKRNFL